jgi:hypothetical protein
MTQPMQSVNPLTDPSERTVHETRQILQRRQYFFSTRNPQDPRLLSAGSILQLRIQLADRQSTTFSLTPSNTWAIYSCNKTPMFLVVWTAQSLAIFAHFTCLFVAVLGTCQPPQSRLTQLEPAYIENKESLRSKAREMAMILVHGLTLRQFGAKKVALAEDFSGGVGEAY